MQLAARRLPAAKSNDLPEEPVNTPDDPKNRPEASDYKPSAYISPRLREKLGGDADSGGDDDFEIKSGSPVGMIVGIAVVVVALVGGVAWMHHNATIRKAQQAAEARNAALAAAADSLQHARAADSLAKLTAAADSVAALEAKKHPGAKTAPVAAATPGKPAAGSPATAAAAGGPAATPAPAAPPQHFGIEAGTFMTEDRAKEEKDKLAAATKLDGKVETTASGDFRVVLGDFGSKKAALKKAAELAAGGQTREATVVAIKP